MAIELATALDSMVRSAAAFLPNLVAAIILLVIGLVVGKIVGRIVKEVLVKIRLDYYVTEERKPPVSLANLFAIITRWWIYLAFIAAALSENILGIPVLAQWVASIYAFIPNVIGATLIVIVGYIIGEYIKTQMTKTGKPYSQLTGKVLFFFIMYVAIALALPVLGINAYIVNNVLLTMIVAVGLAFALAFGLGARDTVGAIVRKWARKAKLV
jgi:hypothetical protein